MELSRHHLLVPDLFLRQARLHQDYTRDAAERGRKKQRTLDCCAKFLILNELLVRCWRILNHELGEVDLPVLWARCQVKSLDSCPINEKLWGVCVCVFQAQNVQIKNSYRGGSG